MRIRAKTTRRQTASGPVINGPYYQIVKSVRRPRKDDPTKTVPHTVALVHLGEYPTAEAALEAWPKEVEHLRSIGRTRQADKLQERLDKLRQLQQTGQESLPLSSL